MIFMQDGAPCRQSKVATEFLKKYKICFGKAHEQPRSQSNREPVDKRDKQLSSAENLRQEIQAVWVTEVTQEYCKSLTAKVDMLNTEK